LADQVTQYGYQIDRFVAENTFRNLITEIVEAAVERPTDEGIRAALAVVHLVKKLGLQQNLYLAQEAVFSAAERAPEFEKFIELSDLLELKTDLLLEKNKKKFKP